LTALACASRLTDALPLSQSLPLLVAKRINLSLSFLATSLALLHPLFSFLSLLFGLCCVLRIGRRLQ